MPGHGDARVNLPPALCPLPIDINKFQRGHLVVVASTPGQGGASDLTVRAALRAGAGAVTHAGGGNGWTHAAMRRDDSAGRALLTDPRVTAVIMGPGLADDERSLGWIDAVLASGKAAVLDAGALTIVGPNSGKLAGSGPLVLTPHDGEFARLFGHPPGHDRVAAALAAAAETGSVVVLKGPQTVIAEPGGCVAVNTHAAPWLATAGSGDVLAGIIGGLMAQGLTPFDAARAGVWLHGDIGVRSGPGLIADDMPDLLPSVFAGL